MTAGNQNLYIAAQTGSSVTVFGVDGLDLSQTLDCGQAFRWQPLSDGVWRGIVSGRILDVRMQGGNLIFEQTTLDEYERLWRDYFDLDRDYRAIFDEVSDHLFLREACRLAGGIRILRQDTWEILCSFIISQNNNIPRIKGIIARLCETLGTELAPGVFSFPDAKAIAAAGAAGLEPLRAGFRTGYLIDAAQKVSDGTVSLAHLAAIPLDEARAELCKIRGVGPKVADCVLLFGAGRVEAFPVDVWIKRVMRSWFPNGLPEQALPYAGILQQCLFHCARCGMMECS